MSSKSTENKLSFQKPQTAFYSTLKNRVDNYFIQNKISDKANAEMIIKTIILFASAIATYYFIVFGNIPTTLSAVLCLLLGVIMAGIGFSVQHDANHGGYSNNKNVNYWLGLSLNILGGNSFIWKVKHNINHHTYTNIEGYDDDIAKHPVFRFSPVQKLKWFHKFQYLYWIPMYSLSSIVWVAFNDYHKYFFGKIVSTTMPKMDTTEKLVFWLTKAISLSISIFIPAYFVGWGNALLGFLFVHLALGYTLSLIFQLAHSIEEMEFPEPNDINLIEEEWAIHQVKTTANFATNNKAINWFVGGLNFQIEHHLFPRVCHVHYTKISKIVEQTCKEFNIPYMNHPTFIGSFASHVRHLKNLGNA
ncbi:MAG: hypothetical protein RIQ33_1214 [Bacteroidota bacterium]|jgi:linoleoyl-CoA desaturase